MSFTACRYLDSSAIPLTTIRALSMYSPAHRSMFRVSSAVGCAAVSNFNFAFVASASISSSLRTASALSVSPFSNSSAAVLIRGLHSPPCMRAIDIAVSTSAFSCRSICSVTLSRSSLRLASSSSVIRERCPKNPLRPPDSALPISLSSCSFRDCSSLCVAFSEVKGTLFKSAIVLSPIFTCDSFTSTFIGVVASTICNCRTKCSCMVSKLLYRHQ